MGLLIVCCEVRETFFRVSFDCFYFKIRENVFFLQQTFWIAIIRQSNVSLTFTVKAFPFERDFRSALILVFRLDGRKFLEEMIRFCYLEREEEKHAEEIFLSCDLSEETLHFRNFHARS